MATHSWQSRSLFKGKCQHCKESIARFSAAKKCERCGAVVHEKCAAKFTELCSRPFDSQNLGGGSPSSPSKHKEEQKEEVMKKPRSHTVGNTPPGMTPFTMKPSQSSSPSPPPPKLARAGDEKPMLNSELQKVMASYSINPKPSNQQKPIPDSSKPVSPVGLGQTGTKSVVGALSADASSEGSQRASGFYGKIFEFIEQNPQQSSALPKPAALRQLKAAIFQWGGQQDWKIGKLLFSEKIVKISAGGSHCIALATNGRAFVWGKQRRGMGVLGTSTDSEEIRDPQPVRQLAQYRVTDVSAGSITSSAITADGKLFIWGYRLDQGSPSSEPGEVPAFEGMAVRAIEFTSFSALVLIQAGETNEDTEVWTWGENNLLLGHPEGDKDENTFPRKVEALVDESVVQISMSETHCAAVTAKGNIFVWGCNSYHSSGQDQDGKPLPGGCAVLGTSIPSSTKWVFVPEKVVFKGEERIRIIQATCGKRFTVALTDCGQLISWGQDNYGCLGLGGQGDCDSPTLIEVPGGENVCFRGVRCGGTHNIAWTDEGTIYSWGCGSKYRLGNPSSDANVDYPRQIQVLEAEGFSNAVVFQIACTVDRSLAFVGPDSALFDFGGAKQFQLTAAAYPTVGDVLSHIAPTMRCESHDLMMLGEDYGELFPDTTIRSIIQGVDTVFYIVRRGRIVQKRVKSGDLLMEDGEVKGGTTEALVDYLLSRWCTDRKYAKVFLLTYRMLGLASSDVLNLLFERYSEPAEMELVPESFPEGVRMILEENVPLKRKVLDVLLFWITNYQDDFFGSELKNAKNISNILNFLLQISNPHLQKICTDIHRKLLFEMSVEMSETDRVLSSLNELILAGGSGGGGSTGSVRPGMSPSASIVNFSASSLPNSMEGLIWKYSTKEIAEQLTFIDSTFIRALPLHEFVATKWVKKELAPNVTRMAVRCTHMVYWAEAELLKSKNLKERLKLVEKLFDIAEALSEIGNFPGFMNIIAVFGRKPVRQIPDLLKSIRKSKELSVRLETMQEKSGTLFKAAKWRVIFDQQPMPKLPFLGPIQTELVFIHDTPKLLEDVSTEDKKVYNFTRVEKTAKLLFDLARYQKATYEIQVIPELLGYLYFARGFDDHENTAKQLARALVSKEEVNEDLIDAPSQLELYDVSSSSDALTEDTATILLNSRAVLACLTKKERKKLWKSWWDTMKLIEKPLKKAKLTNILNGFHWKCVTKKKGDFRDILLGSEGIDTSIQSFIQQAPEGDEGKFLKHVITGLFSSVVNVELFYDTLTLLSQIEAEKSEKKGGEWDGALEFVSKIVKLYKFLGRHDLKLSEADLTKFRLELEKEKNQVIFHCQEENMKKMVQELNSSHSSQAPPKQDMMWDSFKWIKAQKQLLGFALGEIQENLRVGMVEETAEFLKDLQQRRDNATKQQMTNELEWLKSLKSHTDTSIASLETSLQTGLLPNPDSLRLAGPGPSLCVPNTSRRKSLPRKNLLMSSTLQGLSSYAFGGSSASCDGNGLPPHLAFLSDFLERYPKAHPLAASNVNSMASVAEAFLEHYHLPLVKKYETFFQEFQELTKEVEEAYCDAVSHLLTYYIGMLEHLTALFNSFEMFVEKGAKNPEQVVGFKLLLQNCINGIQDLKLDVSSISDEKSQVMEEMQKASTLLESPILLKYR